MLDAHHVLLDDRVRTQMYAGRGCGSGVVAAVGRRVGRGRLPGLAAAGIIALCDFTGYRLRGGCRIRGAGLPRV